MASKIEVSFNPSPPSCLLTHVQKVPLNVSMQSCNSCDHGDFIFVLFLFTPDLRGEEPESVDHTGLEL